MAVSPERRECTRKMIDALVDMLPPPDSVWPVDERKRWLDAMAAVLILSYGLDCDVRTTIEPAEPEGPPCPPAAAASAGM